MIKSKRIVSFCKRNVCDEDDKNESTSTKLEKLNENSRIEENKKQLSNVHRVTYNEFEKSFASSMIERDIATNFSSN